MAEQKFNVKCGFFDSINDDRLYSAEEMNRPYKRVITNGVFATPEGTPSDDLQVLAGTGRNIIVKAGEGLFGDKWFENPSDLVITVPANNDITPRIDSVIAQVDTWQSGRAGNIIYRTGDTNSNPQPPAINTDTNKIEYRLANIYVGAASQTIDQDVITDMRGSAECPWITSLIQQVDTSTLFTQWQTAYQNYYEDTTADFEEWQEQEQTAFEAFMESLTQDLTVNTNLIKYESHYTTSTDGETVIPINISTYNKAKDVLLVRVNRLFASETVDYTIASDSSSITLTKDICANQNVDFIVLQSVVVGDTATVLQEVEILQGVVDKTKVTDNTGGVKISVTGTNNVLDAFKTAGSGYHTMYAAYNTTGVPVVGAYRLFGHMTTANYGWLIALKSDGSMYENYLDNGTWQGWKAIYEKTPTPLYQSTAGTFPNNDVEITPNKALSDCQHGWQLVFTGYNDTESVASDQYSQVVSIPKRSYKDDNWNGETTTFQLVYGYESSSGTIQSCIKSFNVYNDKIVSTSLNSTGTSRNIVLRAIYEY